jgi:phosphoribosylaminoimidazolecarboxamide formyltransferase/IMP cyclohydrolase
MVDASSCWSAGSAGCSRPPDRSTRAIAPERRSGGCLAYARAITEPSSPRTQIPLTEPGTVRVRRALLSVSDKRGIVDFARGLAELGVEVVSTGGTARELEEAGLEVRAVEDLTGFPEIMDGRVKTLHPKLHAGLLAVRDNPDHLRAAADHDVELVDVVCVNLYPFERTAGRRGVSDAEVIEQIDIGGPTMIRAAAKNHAFAAVVVRPESYDAVLEELRDADGTLSLPTRESLAAEAFSYTARYDTEIARWFTDKEDFPAQRARAYEKVTDLPYGENPHQRAAYYAQVGARTHVLSMVRQHHGKPISFNNILDLDAGRTLVRDLAEGPACAIVKHNNPCGAALAGTPLEAYRRALECDPTSAYGGVVVLNRPVDHELAEALAGQFIEVLFAAGYDDDALEVLSARPNLRILEDQERRQPLLGEKDVRQVTGGLLVQDRDLVLADRDDQQVATERAPTDAEWEDLLFAWRVCRHVRSNAIVLAADGATVGVGAGQMSRVDAVRLAVDKSRRPLRGAVMASDAFFPFADGPALAIEAGVTAIIQPGGSVRDDEVVAAADEAGVAMVLTRRRHFRH